MRRLVVHVVRHDVEFSTLDGGSCTHDTVHRVGDLKLGRFLPAGQSSRSTEAPQGAVSATEVVLGILCRDDTVTY